MKRIFIYALALLMSVGLAAQERVTVWPKGKMPNKQDYIRQLILEDIKKHGI